MVETIPTKSFPHPRGWKYETANSPIMTLEKPKQDMKPFSCTKKRMLNTYFDDMNIKIVRSQAAEFVACRDLPKQHDNQL